MTILHRHLLRQNLALLGICLLASMGIYLLVDIFERLDDFLGHGAGLLPVFRYFGLKLPLILSQILPLVFFLALAMQLGILQRSREITALEAGGVSYRRICFLFLLYASIFAVFQLGFSQALGVPGSRKSEELLSRLEGEGDAKGKAVKDVWFRQGRAILHLDAVFPQSDRVEGVRLIRVSQSGSRAEEILVAEKAALAEKGWVLQGVRIQRPGDFKTTSRQDLVLDLAVGMDDLLSKERQLDIRSMSLWELGRAINELEATGANTEAMATLWHQKLAYAFSLVILTAVGLAASRSRQNTVFVICIGFLLGFTFYGVFVLGGQMGERGVVPPWLGGWLAAIMVGVPAFAWLGPCLFPEALMWIKRAVAAGGDSSQENPGQGSKEKEG